MIDLAGFVSLPIILIIVWRQRREIARAWKYRHIFHPALYWGMAGLYALSGALVTFPAFGAVHFNINTSSVAMQILTCIGIVSIGLSWMIARKLATPIFDTHSVTHGDRNTIHGLWAMYWLPGLALGLLPTFVPR